jgi:sortase (surface protein transpeptidase)
VEKTALKADKTKRQPKELPLLHSKKSIKKTKSKIRNRPHKNHKKPSPKKSAYVAIKSVSKKAPSGNEIAAAKKSVATKKPRAKKRTFKLWLGAGHALDIKITFVKKNAKKKTADNLLKSKRRKSAIIVATGLLATGYFASNLFASSTPPVIYSVPAPTFELRENEENLIPGLPASRPTSLKINSIGIETDLTIVGRNSDGTLTVPKEFDTAGWYELSPTPGELGPAIITGHVDSYKGPAVFWRLGQVQVGSSIEVIREDGTVVTFIVEQVKQFDQNNFPTEEVYGNIDHVGLRLITCGGIYSRTTQSYSHNTVVYARLVD